MMRFVGKQQTSRMSGRSLGGTLEGMDLNA